MKILILSKSGDGLGFAQRLAEEDNEVRLFIQDIQYADTGKGMLHRVTAWRPALADADLVICDMVGFGQYEKVLRGNGRPVFSCNKMADLLELDWQKSKELLTKFGISVASEAEAKNLAGVDVATEGWFNGRDWIRPFNHTFAERRLFSDDIGPMTECMGNVVIAAKRENRLVKDTIMKLRPFLKRIGYKGPVRFDTIVTAEQGPIVYNVTARFNYDAIEALLEGLKESVTDLFFETAVGVKHEMDVTEDYLIAVRASLPPWPHCAPADEYRDLNLGTISSGAMKHLYLTDVKKVDGQWLYASGDGVVLKASATGRDIQEARRRVYRTLGGLNIADLQYRTDIGTRVPADLTKIKELGYL